MFKKVSLVSLRHFLIVFCCLNTFYSLAEEASFNQVLPLSAQDLEQVDNQSSSTDKKEGVVQVAAAECPPFIFFNDDGSTTGLTMFLWNRVANSSKYCGNR